MNHSTVTPATIVAPAKAGASSVAPLPHETPAFAGVTEMAVMTGMFA